MANSVAAQGLFGRAAGLIGPCPDIRTRRTLMVWEPPVPDGPPPRAAGADAAEEAEVER